jgi:septum formation protein
MQTPPSTVQLVLASGSPRRRRLLEDLGVSFQVCPVHTDESPVAGESIAEMVLRLAREKAVAEKPPGCLVLAADTMVILDGLGLGKPEDEAHARSMLRRLAGKTHTVMTGVALLDVDREELVSEIEVSEVSIDDIDGDVIDWYVATGEPLDKAGAYAIQGLGALFVQSVSGNYSNIVGLPLPLTQALFRRLGFDLRDFRSRQETNSE